MRWAITGAVLGFLGGAGAAAATIGLVTRARGGPVGLTDKQIAEYQALPNFRDKLEVRETWASSTAWYEFGRRLFSELPLAGAAIVVAHATEQGKHYPPINRPLYWRNAWGFLATPHAIANGKLFYLTTSLAGRTGAVYAHRAYNSHAEAKASYVSRIKQIGAWQYLFTVQTFDLPTIEAWCVLMLPYFGKDKDPAKKAARYYALGRPFMEALS